MLEHSSFYPSNPLISRALEIAPFDPLSTTPAHSLMLPELPHVTALNNPVTGNSAIAPTGDVGGLESGSPRIDTNASDPKQILQQFFAQPDWKNQLPAQLSWQPNLSWLATTVSQGDFKYLPPIQVVSADSLGGKSVTFDWLTGSISLSDSFISQNAGKPAEIAKAVLEVMSIQNGYSAGGNGRPGVSSAWFRPNGAWGSYNWNSFRGQPGLIGSFAYRDETNTLHWGTRPFGGYSDDGFFAPFAFNGNSFQSSQSATLNDAQKLLQSFFAQPNWSSQLPLSLWNQSSMYFIPYQFATGNFKNFPNLQVMSGNELSGKAIAYDESTKSIQVSSWFLEANKGNPSAVVKEIFNLYSHIQHGTLNYYSAPMGSSSWALSTATADAQKQLSTFVAQTDWIEKVKPAFGSALNVDKANAVAQSIASGSLKFDALVKVVPAAALNGANGVYSSASNLFYLSQEFVNANVGSPKVIVGVLIEEFGHYLDTQVNSQDSPGDEGKLFAAIVQGTLLSAADWSAIKAVDDAKPPVIDVFKPLLDPAYTNAQTTLNSLFSKSDWIDQLVPALGSGVDRNKAGSIAQSFLSGQLNLQSLVKVIPATSMGGQEAVFDGNTIYLSEDFINRNATKPEVVTRVLLEGFGHYLDAQLNTTDSQGDEGQMFAAIAQGSLLSAADWYAMRSEDDRKTISLNGQDRLVEIAA